MFRKAKQCLLIIGPLRGYVGLFAKRRLFPSVLNRPQGTEKPVFCPNPSLCPLQPWHLEILPSHSSSRHPFSVASEGPFPIHTGKGSLLCPFVISSLCPRICRGEKKSASFTPLPAESLLRKRKKVCQPPAWTMKARTAPGFNLFYPLVTCGGLCRTAAAKEKFWGPQSYYPLNRLPLSYVYKQSALPLTQVSHWIQGFPLRVKC